MTPLDLALSLIVISTVAVAAMSRHWSDGCDSAGGITNVTTAPPVLGFRFLTVIYFEAELRSSPLPFVIA